MADPLLRSGDSGNSVVELQNLLRAQGFDPGASDGIFGPRTKAAVVQFQTSRGLVPDGIVGPLTWAALRSGGTPNGEITIRLSDFPALSRLLRHAPGADADGYLESLGIDARSIDDDVFPNV